MRRPVRVYCKKCDKMVMSKVRKQCVMYGSVVFLTQRLIPISFIVILIIGGIVCTRYIDQIPVLVLPSSLCFVFSFLCLVFMTLIPCVV